MRLSFGIRSEIDGETCVSLPGRRRLVRRKTAPTRAESQSQETVILHVPENILHSIVSAMTSASLEANDTSREIQLIVSHQEIPGRNLEIFRDGSYRRATLVHESVGFNQEAITAVQCHP